jgi:multisubunit Na+/H+ antiporter MnhF subunit
MDQAQVKASWTTAIGAGWVLIGLLAAIRAFVVFADSPVATFILVVLAVTFLMVGYRLVASPSRRTLGLSTLLGVLAFVVALPGLTTGPWGIGGIALLLALGAIAVFSFAGRRSLT